MEYAVTHRTSYLYRSPVSVSKHFLHLAPREIARQKVLEFALEITPKPAATAEHTDYYGNTATLIEIDKPHEQLEVVARSRVRVVAPVLPEPSTTPQWEEARYAFDGHELSREAEAGEYGFDSPLVPIENPFREFAAISFPAGRPLLAGVIDLTARIHREFKFDRRATNVATPLAEVFQRRRGVCQDFAHVGIACLRSLNLPARYVSGYIETLPPPGRARLVGADASHAWFSAWHPGFGWIDADPTNNMLAGERHITVAWGRDFSDVSPVRGVVVGGSDHRLTVSVDVAPVGAPSDPA
jgi:transglutaminase-like putative cysteine protease